MDRIPCFVAYVQATSLAPSVTHKPTPFGRSTGWSSWTTYIAEAKNSRSSLHQHLSVCLPAWRPAAADSIRKDVIPRDGAFVDSWTGDQASFDGLAWNNPISSVRYIRNSFSDKRVLIHRWKGYFRIWTWNIPLMSISYRYLWLT